MFGPVLLCTFILYHQVLVPQPPTGQLASRTVATTAPDLPCSTHWAPDTEYERHIQREVQAIPLHQEPRTSPTPKNEAQPHA